MSSPHREEFLKGMKKEIQQLEEHRTWELIKKTNITPKEGGSLPNIIPSTWAYKIKKFSDGRLRKFKGRFVVRVDKM